MGQPSPARKSPVFTASGDTGPLRAGSGLIVTATGCAPLLNTLVVGCEPSSDMTARLVRKCPLGRGWRGGAGSADVQQDAPLAGCCGGSSCAPSPQLRGQPTQV